jgi:indole-3-glycerol phosphate synthase
MSADLLGAIVAAAKRSADERERRLGADVAGRLAARRAEGRVFRPGLPIGEAPGFKDPGLHQDLPFERALRQGGVRVIAECKRRSPSRGVLRLDYDAAAIARGYEAAGAAAISVLTEPTFFDGSLDDLRAVDRAVQIPVLRKDFVVTEFQIAEAADAGADAVLLIVRSLSDEDLARLSRYARNLGLTALVEAHDRPELDRALAAGATVVGVNSRDLRTLQVDRTIFEFLAPHIPSSVVGVAESGLESGRDMVRLMGAGYRAFLVGERLMTRPDPGAALAALLGEVRQEGVA